MVEFMNENPNKPLSGPNGNTPSSVYTDMVYGRGCWVTQNSGSRQVRCNDINVIDIINNSDEPDSSDDVFYFNGAYSELPITIYNIDNNPAIVLEAGAEPYKNSFCLVKYTSSGIADWATRIGNLNGFLETPILELDTNKNIYIAGRVFNPTFNSLYIYNQGTSGASDSPSIELPQMTPPTYYLSAIVKYNPNGVAQWATRIALTLPFLEEMAKVFSMSIDSNNNLYISGLLGLLDEIIFYNTPGFEATIPTISGMGLFIVKYDENGLAQWATKIMNLSQSVLTINLNNDIFIFGNTRTDTILFFNAPGAGSSVYSYSSYNGTLLTKYNSDGIFQWATRIEYVDDTFVSPTEIWGPAYLIASDLLGNIYVSATSNGTSTRIYDRPGDIQTLPDLNNPGLLIQLYIVKYNSEGVAQWVTQLVGANTQEGYSMKIDKNNNIYIAGRFRSPLLTIYNSDGNPSGLTLTLNGTENMFLVKYDSSGIAQWATHATATNCSATGISIGKDNNIYITGYYDSPITFFNKDGVESTIGLTDSGIFSVKYNTTGFIQFARRVSGGVLIYPGKIASI